MTNNADYDAQVTENAPLLLPPLPDASSVAIAPLEAWLRVLRGVPTAQWDTACGVCVSVTPSDLWVVIQALLVRLREEAKKDADRVRVQRVVTYEGPRDLVEQQLLRSLHGRRDNGNGVTITAVTVDLVPVAITAPPSVDRAETP